MQRQFTIELRVDYADPAKNEPMKQALLKSARQIQATATLLSDGQKPDIAIFSEDFFVGKEVLDLMQYVKTTDGDEEGVSSELLAAMKENTDGSR